MTLQVARVFFSLLMYVFINVAHATSPASIMLVTENLPPLQYESTNKVMQGYSYELISQVMKDSQIRYHQKVYPWARSYNLATHKKNVCIYSIARLPERESKFIWVAKIAQTNSVIYGLKRNNIELNTIDDAKKYNLAVLRDDATHVILSELGFEEGKNLYVVDNTDSLLKLLYSKSALDLIVADDITIAYRAEKAGISPDEFSRLFELENTRLNFHFACSLTTSTMVIDKIKKSFRHIRQNGTWQQINNKWRNIIGNAMLDLSNEH